MSMKLVIDIGVVCLNLLLMVVVGMELEGQHFRMVFKKKGLLIVILIAQVVLLPVIGYALTKVMNIPPYLNAGILLLAACPVGDIANFYVLLARANVAYSIVVSVLSVILSLVTMTFIFHIYSYLLQEQFIFAIPMPTVIVRLLLILVLPLLAGMGLRHFKPNFVEKYSSMLRTTCLVGLVGLIIYVVLSQHERLASEWQNTAITSGAFIVLSMAVGLAFAGSLGMDVKSVVATGILFPVRNVVLAMVIAITFLNHVEYTVFAVVYFLVEVPLVITAIAVCRRWL
jgi:bile acid:Na+ symporter, BASS family